MKKLTVAPTSTSANPIVSFAAKAACVTAVATFMSLNPVEAATNEALATSAPPTIILARSDSGQIIRKGTFGCTSREEYQRIVGFAAQGDQEAFAKALLAGAKASRCRAFPMNSQVFRAGASWSGFVQIRAKGDTVAYWTHMENMQ